MKDIIQRLDDWRMSGSTTIDGDLVQSARDEIMKLRDGLMTEYGSRLITKARDEAFEEAAQYARPFHSTVADGILSLRSVSS